MNREEKLVTVNKHELHDTEIAFADFMKKSEECFNERSRLNPKHYKALSPSELEEETCNVLKSKLRHIPSKFAKHHVYIFHILISGRFHDTATY